MSFLKKVFASRPANSMGNASVQNPSAVGSPRYESSTPRSSGNGTSVSPELASWTDFYPVLIGAETIGNLAASTPMLYAAAELTERLERDSYVDFLKQFYSTGASRAPGLWRYADITTALLAAATLTRPKRYLEIGVRRGRSMAAVATVQPEVDVVGFDIWEQNYGGMQNPGPAFVRSEMSRLGHRGKLDLVSGDSHITVPKYFLDHPDTYFDLVTVDGDHTDIGARLDLRDVLPRLAIGGVIVFDDIASRGAPFLRDAWHEYVGSQPRFSSWEFAELGFGIALGVRNY